MHPGARRRAARGAAQAIARPLQRGGCEVIGYLDGQRARSPLVIDGRPDVVLIDEQAGAEAHLNTVASIRAAAPKAKLVLLVERLEPELLKRSLAAGIDAALTKSVSPAHLSVLVAEVAAGNIFHAFAPAVPTPVPLLTRHLTERESEVLRLVASGLSNQRVARQLTVTEQTVKFHLSNVYRKLGVTNRTEASHLAHVYGLVGDALPHAA